MVEAEEEGEAMTEEYIGWLDNDWNTVLDQSQPIVRCRDCRHYREHINGCAEFGDESRDEYANVEPDGFCAWGVRDTQ